MGFDKWYDSNDWKEFDQIWSDKSLRNYIESQIRAPEGLREWILTGRANTFRYWGVYMNEIKSNRDKIAELKFENPKGTHRKKGSGTAHIEIREIINSSLSYDNFVR